MAPFKPDQVEQRLIPPRHAPVFWVARKNEIVFGLAPPHASTQHSGTTESSSCGCASSILWCPCRAGKTPQRHAWWAFSNCPSSRTAKYTSNINRWPQVVPAAGWGGGGDAAGTMHSAAAHQRKPQVVPRGSRSRLACTKSGAGSRMMHDAQRTQAELKRHVRCKSEQVLYWSCQA